MSFSDQSYRKGRQGQWANIDMAFRNNASKFLFVKGNLMQQNLFLHSEFYLQAKNLQDQKKQSITIIIQKLLKIQKSLLIHLSIKIHYTVAIFQKISLKN